jgi:hypothetical protein
MIHEIPDEARRIDYLEQVVPSNQPSRYCAKVDAQSSRESLHEAV